MATISDETKAALEKAQAAMEQNRLPELEEYIKHLTGAVEAVNQLAGQMMQEFYTRLQAVSFNLIANLGPILEVLKEIEKEATARGMTIDEYLREAMKEKDAVNTDPD